jgi:hypothetical protein
VTIHAKIMRSYVITCATKTLGFYYSVVRHMCDPE